MFSTTATLTTPWEVPPHSPPSLPIHHRLIAHMTRCWPFYSGCGSIANHPQLLRLTPSTAHPWAKVPGGHIIAPLADHVGRSAYYCGDLDPKLTALIRRIVRPRDTVLDIGANIGLTTVLLASLIGPHGTLHAFEPNPTLHHLLRHVIRRNQLTQTHLHPIALGPTPATLQLNVPQNNYGQGSLVRQTTSPTDQTHIVPVHRLDDVLENTITARTPIRLLKIDVEGYEAPVFQGAQRLLSHSAPHAILCEINHHPHPLYQHPVIQQLLEADYDILSIPRSLGHPTLHRPALDQPPPPHLNDILALRKDTPIPSIQSLIR